MDRPRPVPFPTSLVVKNGSKIRRSSPRGIPPPVTATRLPTGRPPEGTQVRDDLRGLADLLHGVPQLVEDLPLFRHGEVDQVDRIAHEQADVVERIVELVGDARGELAERGELPRLHELLLFVAQ